MAITINRLNAEEIVLENATGSITLSRADASWLRDLFQKLDGLMGRWPEATRKRLLVAFGLQVVGAALPWAAIVLRGVARGGQVQLPAVQLPDILVLSGLGCALLGYSLAYVEAVDQ